MDTTIRRSYARSRPRPGSRGSVYARLGVLAGISAETARDLFRNRTGNEPPHLSAKMMRAANAEGDDEKVGTVLHPFYEEILQISIAGDEGEVLHRCLLIDDEEQVAGRQYIHNQSEYNRKQWLMHSYRQLTATVKVITVLEGRAP